LAESQRDKEIEQAKTDRIQKAEKLGFTNVKFTGGSFTYDLPPTKRKAEVPTESNYLADKPEGFGAFNPAWKPSEIEEYNKLRLGTSKIIRPIPNATVPKSGLNWEVTSYGYEGDNFKGDNDTPKGVGALPKDPTLKPGDVGVSRDVLAQLQSMGYKLGDRIAVKFTDGKTVWDGSFRIADKTSDKLKNRFDLFLPASQKGYIPYDGAKVISVGNRTAPATLKTEEVKKPLAKPTGRKVESKAPSVSDDRKRLDEINRKLNAKPKNMFEGYGG
jgi:hypothetical protein